MLFKYIRLPWQDFKELLKKETDKEKRRQMWSYFLLHELQEAIWSQIFLAPISYVLSWLIFRHTKLYFVPAEVIRKSQGLPVNPKENLFVIIKYDNSLFGWKSEQSGAFSFQTIINPLKQDIWQRIIANTSLNIQMDSKE